MQENLIDTFLNYVDRRLILRCWETRKYVHFIDPGLLTNFVTFDCCDVICLRESRHIGCRGLSSPASKIDLDCETGPGPLVKYRSRSQHSAPDEVCEKTKRYSRSTTQI